MSANRPRAEIIQELQRLSDKLEARYNRILHEEMGQLVKELGRANRDRYPTDEDATVIEMEAAYMQWAQRHQAFLEQEASITRAWASTPRETPVTFDGSNARAFWAHFTVSVINNRALDNRQRMAHLLARVKDHRDAAALVGGFATDGSALADCLEVFRSQYLDEKTLGLEAVKRAESVAPLTDITSQLAVSHFTTEIRVIQTLLKDDVTGSTRQYAEVTRALIAKLPEATQNRVFNKLAKHCPDGAPEGADDESFPSKSSERRKGALPLELILSLLERERTAAGWRAFYERPRTEKGRFKRSDDNDISYPHKRFSLPRNSMFSSKEPCVVCQSRRHITADCTERSAEERARIIRRAGLCLRCTSHRYDRQRPCPNAKPCSKCNGNHHHVTCQRRTAHQGDNNKTGKSDSSKVYVTNRQSGRDRVYLSTITAMICSGERRTPVQVILDSAAEVSLITEEAARNSLTPLMRTDPMTLSGVTEGHRSTNTSAGVTLASIDGSFQIDITAYMTPQITSSLVLVPSEEIVRQALKAGVPIKAHGQKGKVVDILIGQDWLFPFLAPEIVPLGPFIGALKSKLGWYIAGREGKAEARGVAVQMTCQQICQDLTKIYEYIEPEELRSASTVAKPVTIAYDKATAVYTVNLPMRSTEQLGDNFRNAWAQVMALRRKLNSNGQYDQYDSVIKEYVKMGFAERAPSAKPEGKYYVIPHHAVIKKDAEKTKTRVVFNASSAVAGKRSLNECQEKGEPLNADIWAVTIRFRLAQIVLVTDLVKAFSQIRIAPEDRDLLRYLWFERPDDASPTVYRMTSVIFGATSSPHLLGAVLRHHADQFREEYPAVTAQMNRAMYMDDGIFAADNVEQAEEIMTQAESFFAKASFDLHPWLTNDPTVQATRHEFGDSKKVHNCLGIRWVPQTDTLQLKPVGTESMKDITTRRQALSVLARFYDPVSVFAPMKTRIRLFVRDLATPKVDWNSFLSKEENKRLSKMLEELDQIAGKTFPRCLKVRETVELHVFCDASPQAYGAVAYLVDSGDGKRMLLGAKLKLAPKKFATRVQEERSRAAPEVTIPRLELMAAVLGARLVQLMAFQLRPGTPIALYTDSTITLSRIQGDANKQAPFETRRLQAIHELSDVKQWHYIPTEQNPADLLTRDRSTRTWLDAPLWWEGPSAVETPLATGLAKAVRTCLVTQALTLTGAEVDLLQTGYSEAVERMKGMIRVEADQGDTLETRNQGRDRPLSEEHYAVLRVLQLLQQELFPLELARLKANKPVHERSRLRLLDPFVDEWGLMRSRRPAQPQTVDWETRNPIILAPHEMVRDFVRLEHQRLGHAGEANTRSHLAQFYHILGVRRLIKSVVRPCRQCNIQRGRPFRPPAPTLPAFRTQADARPFQYVGIDYFGPLKVKGASKVYGLLITCAVTRAIHIEVVTSLAAKPCLNALTRFISRRGVPSEIHSDNATTFAAMNKALSRLATLVEELSTQKDLASFRCRWIFQTPRAPWFGAFFERMVGVSKRVLQQTQLRHSSNLDDIKTIMSQVEAIVNSRPLIETDDEGTVALTPAHFIAGGSLLAIPPLPSSSLTPVQGSLLKHYQSFCETRAMLQARLQREYLTELRKHHRVHNPTRAPKEGEQVLLTGEDGFEKDRFTWPLAQIVELLPDADGHTRRVLLKWGSRTLERPVKSLVPLEGSHETPSTPGPGNVADTAQLADDDAAEPVDDSKDHDAAV